MIIDNVEVTHKDRVPSALVAILSCLLTLFLAGFNFYLSSLGNYFFIAIAIIFILLGAFIMVPLFIKDDYKAMRIQGIAQIIGVLFLMPYLLFMILWNDANQVMDYSLVTFLILGGLTLIYALIYIISGLANKKSYHPLMHAYGNNALIIAFYLLIIIELIIVNKFYPGESTAVFDNVLQQKPVWVYIIDILLNGVLTVFAALLALSTAIRAKTKEELSTSGKIKHTLKWFSDNEVSMFFGLIFTLYLAVLSLINMKQSFFYILLFIYYIGTASIRFINYYWHKKIEKKVGDNQIKDNRLSSWILLFDAVTYLAFSDVLVAAAIVMMIQKVNVGSNIYLFLFVTIPMAIFRFFTANKSIRKNRVNNNTYRLGVSLIGLVSLFFSILEVVAISCHELPVVWLRVVFIIIAIIMAKIAVIVVSIIFVIHWFRSIILNRWSKERKYLKEKNKNS